MIVDLAILLVALLLTGLTALGWGRLTYRMFGLPVSQKFDTSILWLGFVAIVSILELWHIFFAIDWKASVLFAGLGAWQVLSVGRKQWQAYFTACKAYVSSNRTLTCIAVVLCLVWCLRAMMTPHSFDSGLYHFGSIRWLNEYAIVPGLSHVHWRFGFNQSYFGFLAVLNLWPIWDKGYATGGLFLLLLTAGTIIETGMRFDRLWRLVFFGSLFLYLSYLASSIADPTPDTAIGLLEIVVMMFLVRIAITKNLCEIRVKGEVLVVVLLCVTLLTTKLSSIAFSVCAVAALLVLLYQVPEVKSFKGVGRLLAALLVLAIVHITRGYLLSGVPLFPIHLGAVPALPWMVAPEFIQYETRLIYSWARLPGVLTPDSVLQNWDWLPIWLNKLSSNYLVVFISATGLAILHVALVVTSPSKQNTKELVLYLPIVLGFIFWFFTAPDVRFAGALLPLYFALALHGACKLMFAHSVVANYISKLQAVGLVNRLYFLSVLLVCLFVLRALDLASLSYLGWQTLPAPLIDIKTSSNARQVYVPVTGASCWNAPLPCMSVFNPALVQHSLSEKILAIPLVLDRPVFQMAK